MKIYSARLSNTLKSNLENKQDSKSSINLLIRELRQKFPGYSISKGFDKWDSNKLLITIKSKECEIHHKLVVSTSTDGRFYAKVIITKCELDATNPESKNELNAIVDFVNSVNSIDWSNLGDIAHSYINSVDDNDTIKEISSKGNWVKCKPSGRYKNRCNYLYVKYNEDDDRCNIVICRDNRYVKQYSYLDERFEIIHPIDVLTDEEIDDLLKNN